MFFFDIANRALKNRSAVVIASNRCSNSEKKIASSTKSWERLHANDGNAEQPAAPRASTSPQKAANGQLTKVTRHDERNAPLRSFARPIKAREAAQSAAVQCRLTRRHCRPRRSAMRKRLKLRLSGLPRMKAMADNAKFILGLDEIGFDRLLKLAKSCAKEWV